MNGDAGAANGSLLSAKTRAPSARDGALVEALAGSTLELGPR